MTVNTAVRGVTDRSEGVGLAVSAGQAERDHELRAALFALQVTAGVLSRDRDRISSRDVDELMDGLVAEIGRLRTLVEHSPRTSPASFDLGEALAGTLACARAAGLVVHSSIPSGVHVHGHGDDAAQVVLALLDNVRQHAGSSPVDIDVAHNAATVVVTVADRGPGVDDALRGRLFDRGARRPASAGSGLGLYIARRVMI